MMAGSRTFSVLPLVFLTWLMRCDGNALDLPVHLSGKEATVTKVRCDAKDAKCVIVKVTECPVTAHVCHGGKVTINNATRDGCLIASQGGINGTNGMPFIEIFVDNVSLTKQAECNYTNALPEDTITTPAIVSFFNATKMTLYAGDAVSTGHHNVTRDRGVFHGSIRDIAVRLAGDKKQIALTPEISNSTSSFEVFHSSCLDTYSLYKSNFTSGHQGAMVEVYILGTLDYQVHIDTDTSVYVFPAPKLPLIAEPQITEVPSIASIATITVPICLLAVICVIAILAFFFKKRRSSRRLDVPDGSQEAVSLQTVTTSNGSEESSRNTNNDGLIEEESSRV